MRLIVSQDESMIAEIDVEHQDVYIGSRPDCQIHLTDARVASHQAVIAHEKANTWRFRVLESEPQFEINGRPVVEDFTLKTGDEIRLFEYLIRAFPDESGGAATAPGHKKDVQRLTQFAQSQLPAGSQVRRADELITLQPGHLQEVGRVAVRMSQAESVESLMDAATKVLFELFAAHRVWIGIRRLNYGAMDYVQGRRSTGQTIELPEVGDLLKVRPLDRNQFVLIPRLSVQDHTAILVGPLAGPESTLGMLYLDSGPDGRRYNIHDLDLFTVVSAQIAAQLDAIFQQLARNRAATIVGEVSVAHAIQARLTPRKLPQWDTIGFGAFREQGADHSGDFYDIVKLANGAAMFILAHTPGHGPVPSMVMAQVQAAFRMAAMHQDPPHVLLKSLNWLMYDGEKDHPLHGYIGLLDPQTADLQFGVAGQLGAYIIGQRGDERSLLPDPPQAPLASAKNTDYALQREQLGPGETLALFTPGVTAARNNHGETFGEERFVDILCDGFGQLASSMLKEMLTDLRGFTQGGALPNDITVILAHHT